MKKITLFTILSLTATFALADKVYYPSNTYLIDGKTQFIAERPEWIDNGVVKGIATTNDINDISGGIIDRVDNLESATNILNTAVGNLNSATNALNTAVGNLNTATNSLNGRVGNLESATNTLNGAVNALNLATNDLSGKVSDNTTAISNLNTATNNLSGRVGNLETATNNLNTAVNNLNSATNSLNGRVDNLESATNALNTAVGNLNTATNDLNGRVSTIENSYVTKVNDSTGAITITEAEDIKVSTDGSTITVKTQYAAERSFFQYLFDGTDEANIEKDWSEQHFGWEVDTSDATVTLTFLSASEDNVGQLILYLTTDDSENNHYELNYDDNVVGYPSTQIWTTSSGNVSIWKIELESIPMSEKWYFKKATEFVIE